MMAVAAHFIEVGQGNMALLQLPNGTTMLYDCNVTDENEARVLGYLGSVLPRRGIDIFVNSHREADHMRGVKRVHDAFPFSRVWDSGVTGGSTDSAEYREYMELRRSLPCITARRQTHCWFGTSRLRIMNANNDYLPDDPNAQSIVIKVENWQRGSVVNSLMLTGDSDAVTWERSIIPLYGDGVASTILLGSHHCADGFFVKPNGGGLYLGHIPKIRPRLTVISVGDNNYGHPAPLALGLYGAFSTGGDFAFGSADLGLKVLRTDRQGTMRLQLNDDGSWWIVWNGPTPQTPLARLVAQWSLAEALGPQAPMRPMFRSLADSARPAMTSAGIPALPSTSAFSALLRAAVQPPALGLDLSPLPNDLGTVLASLARRPPGLPFK